jgi:hypothetical protein
MFIYLFGALIEFGLWTIGIYVVYRLIFSKSIIERKRLKNLKLDNEKLALLVLKSNDIDKVSSFMKENVSSLSNETFIKLNEHLDYLNIMSEEPLKARFKELELPEDYNLNQEEIIDNKAKL